jgi:hypothetical protein
MPPALTSFVRAERLSGRALDGPLLFHCTHRAFGVGMFDVREAVVADEAFAAAGGSGPTRMLVGTVSHCHGALGVIALD